MSSTDITGKDLQRARDRFTAREYQLQGTSTKGGNQWIPKRDGNWAFANSASKITQN